MSISKITILWVRYNKIKRIKQLNVVERQFKEETMRIYVQFPSGVANFVEGIKYPKTLSPISLTEEEEKNNFT